MCAEFLVALLEPGEDEVRSGKVGDHIIVCLRNVPIDEPTKGAVIGLPDIMCFRMEGGVWLRESPFQPFHKSKAIALHLELETPLFPVQFREVKMEIGGPGGIGHETFGNGDVTGGRGIGMQTHRCVGIRNSRGPSSGGRQLLGNSRGLPRGRSGSCGWCSGASRGGC